MKNIIIKIKKENIVDSGEIPLSDIVDYLLELVKKFYDKTINDVNEIFKKLLIIDKNIKNVEDINRQLSLTIIDLESDIKKNRNQINELINIFSESQKLTGFVHISSIGNYSSIEKIIDKPGFLYYNLDINAFKISYLDIDGKIKFKIS